MERSAPLEGELILQEAGLALSFRIMDADESGGISSALQREREHAYFDLDGLSLPLTVRSRRSGDRMRPLGLNGTKKVQDMFVDAKVPPSRRELLPLLCDAQGQILWIPGVRRSHLALAGPSTGRLLCVEAQPLRRDIAEEEESANNKAY